MKPQTRCAAEVPLLTRVENMSEHIQLAIASSSLGQMVIVPSDLSSLDKAYLIREVSSMLRSWNASPRGVLAVSKHGEESS